MADLKSKQPPIVYIWHLGSDHFRSIGTFSNQWLWRVDPDENVLITFEINWDTHPPEVQQTKWTLTGMLLDQKQFHLLVPGCRVDKRYSLQDSYSGSGPECYNIHL